MGSLTDVFEKKVLDYIFRDASIGLHASNHYIALFTTNPTDSTTGTEVSGSAYARVAVDRTGSGFDAAAGTTALTDNTSAITFPTASGGNWGTITGVGICKSSAGSLSTDLVFWGALNSSVVINDGDTFQINAGDLDITLD